MLTCNYTTLLYCTHIYRRAGIQSHPKINMMRNERLGMPSKLVDKNSLIYFYICGNIET